jgi:hypothetical protein
MDATTRRRTLAAKAPVKQKPVEKMDGIEVALAFCKECLGWKDAEEYYNKVCANKIPSGWNRSLDPYRLTHVMDAIWRWIKPKGIIPPHHAAILVRVPGLFSKYFYHDLNEEELCRELMAACMEANRSRR